MPAHAHARASGHPAHLTLTSPCSPRPAHLTLLTWLWGAAGGVPRYGPAHLTLTSPHLPRYGARLPVAELLPELLDDLTGAAAAHAMPARLAACFGPPQQSNPVCYVGAGGQATPLHFDPHENLLCVVEGAKHLR